MIIIKQKKNGCFYACAKMLYQNLGKKYEHKDRYRKYRPIITNSTLRKLNLCELTIYESSGDNIKTIQNINNNIPVLIRRLLKLHKYIIIGSRKHCLFVNKVNRYKFQFVDPLFGINYTGYLDMEFFDRPITAIWFSQI
jgi:hypothetical protein